MSTGNQNEENYLSKFGICVFACGGRVLIAGVAGLSRARLLLTFWLPSWRCMLMGIVATDCPCAGA